MLHHEAVGRASLHHGPPDFRLKAGKGVNISGFSDLTSSSTSRGTKGAGAASLTAKASDLGALNIKSR